MCIADIVLANSIFRNTKHCDKGTTHTVQFTETVTVDLNMYFHNYFKLCITKVPYDMMTIIAITK